MDISVPEGDGRAPGASCVIEIIVDVKYCSSGGGREIEYIAIQWCIF